MDGYTGGQIDGTRVYSGHTRFATTSKVTFEGTHPHQWTPPMNYDVFDGDWTQVHGIKRMNKRVEVFITHNGDFDALEVDGTTYELGVIQRWLVRATGSPMPATVDSCAVAGVFDLLRAKGSWFHAVRLAFLIGIGAWTRA